MENNVVIVESPAKAKTIEKYLGAGYKVLSSYGHIRDLKEKGLGVEIKDDFKPIYEIPEDKQKVVETLKTAVKKADTVWLASDEDREGEAISWHLAEVLHLDPAKTKRIVFHEITKSAIQQAIEHPRTIDLNLVSAQQARRVLDRIVGFELSPVLWRKVRPSLSAGRVQSVAVRLIVEREREITGFQTEASYRVTAVFQVPDADGKPVDVKAELPTRFPDKAAAYRFLEDCAQATFSVQDITMRPLKKVPAAPFTTSTLQQEAARKLNFTVAQTMRIAQNLYESGLISYMRTDSVNLSNEAINGSRATISELMGDRYVKTRHYTTKAKGAQEAHEAIRPTAMGRNAIQGSAQEQRLYELIWKRTIASQMADAEVEKTIVTIGISGKTETFAAVGEVVKFDGFLRVYRESYDDDTLSDDESSLLPPMKQGQSLAYKSIEATERFTQAPLRYTEASLVRKMEELGIGRPSTYAPTISTIQKRGYVEKGNKTGTERAFEVLTLKKGLVKEATKKETIGNEKGKLLPTDIGLVVNDFLTAYFPNIMDYHFTADMEQQLDEVAEGKKGWTKIIKTFYQDFHPEVETAINTRGEHRVGERVLGTDPVSGKQVTAKIGRFGPAVQIGTADDAEKPRFATLTKGLSIETITLDEALELFKLPRTLGDYENKVVVVGIGRFGPYVRHDGKFVAIPKGADPMAISLEEATELILAHRQAEAAKVIREFDEEPELSIRNGRYGAYIAYKGANYKIPKGTDPASLDCAATLEIVKQQGEKPAKPAARKPRKTAAKK
ncbi:MAG: type I DNA topoisomerase [Prevotellaceae bacterium]|jgi:DNA topoisomerase-1|nr:type I DNA topoisomerase [Prevotellaceae bacterium]